MSIKGIDISTWQGKDIDFTAVKKSGIEFVILRAGYGREVSQKDDCFDENYRQAKEAGLKLGAYWFSYADSAEDAKREAKACLQCVGGKKLDLPVFFDLELDRQFAKGRAFCDSLIEAFCEEILKGGYKTGLYMSYSPLMSCTSSTIREKYPLWIAQYYSHCQYDGKFAIWQYSDRGRVNGLNGDIDMDILYDTALLKSENSVVNSAENKIDVTYQVYADRRWLPKVTNFNDTDTNGYAGIEQSPIQCVKMKPSKGNLKYRVHTIGARGYLPWVTDFSDYAGLYGKDIDKIQAEYKGDSKYVAQYRVALVGDKNYLPWVTSFNNTDGNGYAGIEGREIDRLQIRIVKK